MGLGDWIMATSQVKTLHEKNGRQVLVVDRLGRPRWSEVFVNNPRIVRSRTTTCQQLLNAGGVRPYISQKTIDKWYWKRWDIKPGELFLSQQEKEFAAPFAGCILIEPNTKVPGGNKSWRWERWQELVDRFPDLPWVQVGDPNQPILGCVKHMPTVFREAVAILSACKAFIGSEGALHHAAAALGIPAVVLWSEFISPEFTGYPSQRNIRHAGKACGARNPCASCRQSMDAITVDEVEQELREMLA